MVQKKTTYTVAVTGFAPYREHDHNTSSIIRTALPTRLTRPSKPPITILKYPHDIQCTYTEVLNLVPKLWSGKRPVYEIGSSSEKHVSIDLMMHIGMHPDEGYQFEKRARSGRYERPGMDESMLGRDAFRGMPETLVVEIDVEGVVARVRESMPDDVDIQVSNDAGLYFCELITYASLALLDKRKEFGRAVFLHVPNDQSEESIERGVKVATALILECVDSLPSEYKKAG